LVVLLPLHANNVMNRLFGAKSTAPKPTLNNAISNVKHPAPATTRDES
jgi:hypothetical protein